MADEAFQLIEYITTGEYDKKMTEDVLLVSQLTKPIQMVMADRTRRSKRSISIKKTTFYDWAAGVESNNDITPVLQENTQKPASRQTGRSRIHQSNERSSRKVKSDSKEKRLDSDQYGGRAVTTRPPYFSKRRHIREEE